MIVLDASVMIAMLTPTDAHHANARSLLDQYAADGFLAHAITLAEVLVDPVRLGRGVQRLADLKAMSLQVTASDETESLQLAELRASTGLKLPDCCVLVTAMRGPSALATFDTQLARAAESLGLELAN